MAELTITITVPDDELTRMIAGFARRFKNPDLTQEQMLAGLKANAIEQIKNVVLMEERAAISEQADAVVALNLS